MTSDILSNPLSLTIPEHLWRPHDLDDGGYPFSWLRTTLRINSRDFHLFAIEVTEPPVLDAVNPQLQDDLDSVVSLLGGRPETQNIEGRPYVVYAVPFSD